MPYQAAKAIASTFCYNIRWALTPVFGNDFPSTCLPPNNPNYAKFLIDRDIVQECTDETDRFRVEGASYRVAGAKLSTESHTPRLQFGCPPCAHRRWFSAPQISARQVDACLRFTKSYQRLCQVVTTANHFEPSGLTRKSHSVITTPSMNSVNLRRGWLRVTLTQTLK
jgi:hypothetical protein